MWLLTLLTLCGAASGLGWGVDGFDALFKGYPNLFLRQAGTCCEYDARYSPPIGVGPVCTVTSGPTVPTTSGRPFRPSQITKKGITNPPIL